MKKISCVGYHATGSGAVDDFLREFDNIEAAKYGVECRFLQDPDGISDLEYNLIENPHRLNSGFALKRFLLFAKSEERSYRHIFGKKWIPWAESYINELSEFKYNGYWHGDTRIVSFSKLFFYKARKAVNLYVPKRLKKNKYYSYFPSLDTYFVDIDEDNFLKITREKCEELCSILNSNQKDYVVLDQVVSPQNINRYLRYISDLQIIVVDRDPRDVYLNDVIIHDDHVLPVDIQQFCRAYEMSRKTIEPCVNDSVVLKINFEDMIYAYENTTKRIMEFLGLSETDHTHRQEYFIPDISKQNTRIWERNDEYRKIANQIADNLPDYLYPYSQL